MPVEVSNSHQWVHSFLLYPRSENLVVNQNNDPMLMITLFSLCVCFIVSGWCVESLNAYLTEVLIKADLV